LGRPKPLDEEEAFGRGRQNLWGDITPALIRGGGRRGRKKKDQKNTTGVNFGDTH